MLAPPRHRASCSFTGNKTPCVLKLNPAKPGQPAKSVPPIYIAFPSGLLSRFAKECDIPELLWLTGVLENLPTLAERGREREKERERKDSRQIDSQRGKEY